MKTALFVVIPILFLLIPANAQPAFPIWVAVTQEYTYPGTQLSSSAGMIEQAIGADNINYIVTASDGRQLRLPKAYARQATAEEAARSLFQERNKTAKILLQYEQYLLAAATALKNQQSQGASMNDAQQALQILQQMNDLHKPQDRRRIPNQNRYEINTR